MDSLLREKKKEKVASERVREKGRGDTLNWLLMETRSHRAVEI